MKKHFLFISTVNLTTNPRILKEIRLALSQGYQVTFLGFHLGNWSDELDRSLPETLPGANFIYLDATRKQFPIWLFSTVVEKISGILCAAGCTSMWLTAFASSKRAVLLCRQLNKFYRQGIVFDISIAHTLGALYPASWFAKKTNSSFAFDVEDYHPWESIRGNDSRELLRRETIMKKILPHALYVSAAAPLISSQVSNLVQGVAPVTILNYFSKNEFVMPAVNQSPKIKLVWFSQNINAGRGLELLLQNWESLERNFELTLIGKPEPGFYEQYLRNRTGIVLLQPMKQEALHQYLGEFDIGLAIDTDADDNNRKLVITNKILAYYQAGLYIAATNTPAQQVFIKEHPAHGMIMEQDPDAVLYALQQIIAQRDVLRNNGNSRFEAAAAYNWERESGLLIKNWVN